MTRPSRTRGPREAVLGRARRDRRPPWTHRDRSPDEGFTLVELLITIMVLPLVVGAISVGLLSVLSLQGGVADRVSGSGDSQTINAIFLHDVQGSQWVQSSTTPVCSSGASGEIQLVAFSWGGTTAPGLNTVSYAVIPNSGASDYRLVRESCTAGSSTATYTQLLAGKVTVGAGATHVEFCTSSLTNCAPATINTWDLISGTPSTPDVGYIAIDLKVVELQVNPKTKVPGISYQYTLVASPRLWNALTVAPGGIGYAPLTLLGPPAGTPCPSTVLQVGNTLGSQTAVLYINNETGYTGVTSSTTQTIANTDVGKTLTWSVNATQAYDINQDVRIYDTNDISQYLEGIITTVVPASSISVKINNVVGTNNTQVSTWAFMEISNGVLAINSTCPGAVQLGGTINSDGILTTNPNLNTIQTSSGTSPIPEYYASNITDPLAALLAPLTPASTAPGGTPAGSCSKTAPSWDTTPGNYTWFCLPGNYTQDPFSQFNMGGSLKFEPAQNGAGQYWFAAGMNLPNNLDVFFGNATFVFEGTGNVLNTGNSSNDTLTGSGALFYTATGNLNFGNNLTINLTGSAAYFGVAIWDAASYVSGVSGTVILSNNGTSDAYGGIYVPLGTVQTANNGSLSVSFLVASGATFLNGTVVNITAP